MVIDIHNHADYHGYNAAMMVDNMDEKGVDITCLLSWEAPRYDYDPGSKRVLSPFSEDPVPFGRCVSYKEYAPERFLLGFCPDPRRPDAIMRLKSAVSLYNISMCGELKLRMMYDNLDAVRMYRYCGQERLPVLVHLDYELSDKYAYPWPCYWYGGGVDAFERAVALCPETNFIGHAPGFWAHISGDDRYKTESYPDGPVLPGGRIQQMLDKYPNLYCDISAGSGHNALNRDREHAKKFLKAYQDRICFGRDYYDSVHKDLLDNLGLPEDVLTKIYEGNARKILRNGDKISRA